MTGIARYKKTSVSTASRERIVVLLYDGFIRFAQAANDALTARQPSEAGESIRRALAIIHELSASLNPAAHPELVANLSNLYDWVEERLHKANRCQDPSYLNEVLAVMSDLRDGWATAAATSKAA